jgi:predicted sulfurtransferase
LIDPRQLNPDDNVAAVMANAAEAIINIKIVYSDRKVFWNIFIKMKHIINFQMPDDIN